MYSFAKFIATNLYLLFWMALAVALFKVQIKKANWKQWKIGILAFLWIIATRPVSDAVMIPLQQAFTIPKIEELRESGIKEVVVLTGGEKDAEEIQLNAEKLTYSSLKRFSCGVELCTELGKDCIIIFSGGSPKGPTAKTMSDLAKKMQPDRTIYMETESKSTDEHAENVRRFLKNKTFILITSASHMVRAIRVFRKADLDPIPYPVEFFSTRPYSVMDFFPSIYNIERLESALYEYLAQVYYILKA